jgi:hypothetical protein
LKRDVNDPARDPVEYGFEVVLGPEHEITLRTTNDLEVLYAELGFMSNRRIGDAFDVLYIAGRSVSII